MEVISLWHCWGGMETQVSLTVAFSSSTFFGLLFLIFLLTIPIDSLCSGLVSLLASQAHQHHGHLTNFCAFGSVDRSQILLGNVIIFKKLVSRRKHEVLQNVLVNGCSDVDFQKNTMDQHQQILIVLIMLRFSRLVVHLFFHTFSFHSTSVNMFGYRPLWQPASLVMNVCGLPSLVKGVNDCLLDNCQISSLPHDCVA